MKKTLMIAAALAAASSVSTRGILSARADVAGSSVVAGDPTAQVNEIQKAFAAFQEANDKRLSDLEKGREDVVQNEKVDRINAAVSKLEGQLDDTNKQIAALNVNGAGANIQAANPEYTQAFNSFLRKGVEAGLLDSAPQAAATVQNDTEGGYTVPAEMSDRVIRTVDTVSPIRQLATVMTISTDAVEMLRDTDDAEAEWVSETGTRNDTTTGSLGRIRIPVHEIHAQPKATQKLLDDSNLNVEAWLTGKVSKQFVRTEDAGFINGDGVGKPRGLASYKTVATSDKTRAWGSFEHVLSNEAGTLTDPDALISMIAKLKSGYLPNASWLLSTSVLEVIRKFKEPSGSYLWQPSFQAGEPSQLLGYSVHKCEDMDDIGAGNLPVAFGDVGEAYTIVDRVGLSVLRDPYTAAPFVKFRCSKRVGGDVTNFEALKFLRIKS